MAQSDPCKYQGKRVLLVEGIDDCHVILALCQAHGVLETFGIYQCGGFTEVLKRLNALILQPDAPEVIGVVLDADSPGVMARWQQISAKSELKHYSFPTNPDINGTVISAPTGKPRLGIWLMPDNTNPGMLEDFLTELAPLEGITAAKNCVASAQQQQLASFKPTHLSKAVIHTYLAWQDEPGKPLGQSVTSRVLQPDMAIARSFTAWLTKLFLIQQPQ